MAGPSRRQPDYVSADGQIPHLGKAFAFREAHEIFSAYDFFWSIEVEVIGIQSELYVLCDIPGAPKRLSLRLDRLYYEEAAAKIEKARRLTQEGNSLLSQAKRIRAELRGRPVYTGETSPKPLYRGEEEQEDGSPDPSRSDDQQHD